MYVMYARAKCRDGKWVGEDLVEHLINVGSCAKSIAEKMGLGGEVAEMAELAGYLHDVGKAVFQKPTCRDGEELTFPGHEIVGAAVAKLAGRDVVARAVLLHHQGLRGVDIHNWKIDSKVVSIDAVKNSLIQLRQRINSGGLAHALGNAVDRYNQLGLLLRNIKSLAFVERDKLYTARVVTAILMIADNVVASKAAERLGLSNAKSRYVEDLEKFVQRLEACSP